MEPVVIQLPAEIDLLNAEAVRDLLVKAAAPGVAVVVADLAATAFCDSAGFRELVAARQKLAAAAVELRLAAPRPNVRRIMEIIGLDQVWKPYPSVLSAVAGVASSLEAKSQQ
jgi:anti-sigma B factor antagonist